MKPFRLLQGLALCIASAALAASPANKPGGGGPGSSLAEQLARKEASVAALDHHLTTAAQKNPGPAVDPRLAERAKKLAQHHAKVPLASLQYVRTVPGAADVSTTYRPEVAQREAESAAAALGDDLNALWARRQQVEAERMVLWSKIAFRAVAARELSDQPLYRFELKALAGKTADAQRIEAMMAAAQFVRVVDHLAAQAQDAVDSDAPAVYDQWHKLLTDARKRLEDKLLLQADLAMDVYKPTTDAGRLAAYSRQLCDLAQAIVDDQRELAAADKAEDDEEADASRAQLQKVLADTAGAVAELDASVNRAAKAWDIGVVPGTKAAVGELPDLGVVVVASSNGATQSADPIQAGTVWESDDRKLKILERKGDSVHARFEVGPGITRIISGVVRDGKFSWLAKDVYAVQGGVGGDNSATIDGDRLDFQWHDEKGTWGHFILYVDKSTLPRPLAATEAMAVPPGARIVFLCQASGAMLNKFASLRREAILAIDGLTPSQFFTVITFQDQVQQPFDGFSSATTQAKLRAKAFLDDTSTGGKKDPIKGMTAALALKPEIVYFMTDGNLPDPNGFYIAANRANSGVKAKINVIVFGTDQEPASAEAMRRVVAGSGGVMTNLTEPNPAKQATRFGQNSDKRSHWDIQPRFQFDR